MAIHKLIKSVTILIVFFLLAGCSNDDNGNEIGGDDQIRGSWELLEIRNTSIPRTIEAPTDEEPILLFFFEVEFNGRTPNNDFNGSYTADGEELSIRNFGSTTEDDTTWANQFFFAISQGYNVDLDQFQFNYTATETSLTIQYDEDLFLYFERY